VIPAGRLRYPWSRLSAICWTTGADRKTPDRGQLSERR
jgi:hypothetical protein